MKTLLILFTLLVSNEVTWLGDIKKANDEAVKTHRAILINFSGSDWCAPCIRLRKDILESPVFTNYASEHLVLVRADFPRQKKNQLSRSQIELNEALADKYNPDGKFPYTLLIDEHGKVLRSWDGYPDVNAQQFVDQINIYGK